MQPASSAMERMIQAQGHSDLHRRLLLSKYGPQLGRGEPRRLVQQRQYFDSGEWQVAKEGKSLPEGLAPADARAIQDLPKAYDPVQQPPSLRQQATRTQSGPWCSTGNGTCSATYCTAVTDQQLDEGRPAAATLQAMRARYARTLERMQHEERGSMSGAAMACSS